MSLGSYNSLLFCLALPRPFRLGAFIASEKMEMIFLTVVEVASIPWGGVMVGREFGIANQKIYPVPRYQPLIDALVLPHFAEKKVTYLFTYNQVPLDIRK